MTLSRQLIIETLTAHGPMTMREIAEELGADIDALRGFIGSIRQKKPGVIYIHSWRRDTDGGRLYPRALWAAGSHKDARRPQKLGRSEYNRRAREKRKACIPSIFHVGLVNRTAQSKIDLSESFQ